MPETAAGLAKRRASSKNPRGRTSVSAEQGRQPSSLQNPRADTHPVATSTQPIPTAAFTDNATAPRLSSSTSLAKGAVPNVLKADQKQRRSGSNRPQRKKTKKAFTSAGTQRNDKPRRAASASQEADGGLSVSPFAATDPLRYRNSLSNGASNSSGNNPSNQNISPSSYSSQVHPPSDSGGYDAGTVEGNGRRPTTPRLARGVVVTVAVARLQRAARVFLMRRALQRIVSPTLQQRHSGDELPNLLHDCFEDSGNPINILIVPSAPPAAESRMVHRIKAELDRMERLDSLRAMIAKRTLVAALRGWVHRRRATRRQCRASPTYASDREEWEEKEDAEWLTHVSLHHRTVTDGTVEKALCTLQAVLHARSSSSRVAQLRYERRQSRAATRIQRAWRHSPFYGAYIRRLHNGHAREVLCRQESLERRDVLRHHLLFLVRCHQQLYNAPCMWEAGLSIRRLPLYNTDGLFLSEYAGTYAAGSMRQLSAPTAKCNSSAVAHDGDSKASPSSTMPAALRFTRSPFHTAIAGETSCEVKNFRDGHDGRDGRTTDVWWTNDDQVDVDAELRHYQYRLFFSPDDRRLLADQGEYDDLIEGEPREASAAAVRQWISINGVALHKKVTNTSSPLPAPGLGDGVSYAQAFASALAFLRQLPAAQPATQYTLQQLEAVRRDPVKLLRVLRTHGHLAAELVAPFTCYGLRYQSVARGEEDQSILSSTHAMQICQPVVTCVAANAAAELRNCLVGTVARTRKTMVTSGTAAAETTCTTVHGGAGLPLPLVDYISRREATRQLFDSGIAPQSADAATLTPPAPAMLQRSGFASPATQALFNIHCAESATATTTSGDGVARGGGGNHAEGGDSHEYAPAAWDHRLTAGEHEVGAVWRQFLLSIPTTVSTASSFENNRTVSVERERKAFLPKPPLLSGNGGTTVSSFAPSGRRLVGLSSHLFLSSNSAPLLLKDFAPPSGRHPTSAVKEEAKETQPASSLHVSSVVADRFNGARDSRDAATSKHAAEHPYTVVRIEDWWDAVERLFLQERFKRRSVEQNENEQRRSVGILRRLSPSASAVTLAARA